MSIEVELVLVYEGKVVGLLEIVPFLCYGVTPSLQAQN